MPVDYSLYLVTDSTHAILGDRDLASVVEAAVAGGVTIVQYRDKTADTAQLVRTAKRLHSITKAAAVPLLINDRIDVALAVGCEGVHIGQDDIDLETARRILGADAIIGVTASTVDEAVAAAKGGADYLGIGTVYATATKENTKSIIGTTGVQEILSALSKLPPAISTVCIGGINASNAQRVLFQSRASCKALDGIAVVSAIIASPDPKSASTKLKRLISVPPPFAPYRAEASSTSPAHDIPSLLQATGPKIVCSLASKSPLCHNMTNTVVQNFAANIALSVGSSPIMSMNPLEASDLAALGGSLVVNMGTLTPDILSAYISALKAYNAVGGPVLLDPVGAGATEQRREAVRRIMAEGYFDVIKGNEGEIKTVAGQTNVQQRGVDSGPSSSTFEEKIQLVKELAARQRNIVLMTGKVDIISDGSRTFAIRNGHKYLGAITGSGCTLGTTIASFLAIERHDKMLAVVTAIVMYEIAAEIAAEQESVNGPGTFVPAFIDTIYELRQRTLRGDVAWLDRAKLDKAGD